MNLQNVPLRPRSGPPPPTATMLFLPTVLSLALVVSCIELDLPETGGLFPDASFIISGTLELDSDNPACSIFAGDNGVDYQLFQGPRLTNDEFDQIFQDQSRSRLEIQIREDLELRECRHGRQVEVVRVLEFIPS